MKSVYVVYNVDHEFGYDETKDKTIRKIMAAYDEEGSGSGLGQRDISFRVPIDDVESVVAKLKEAGFSTEVYDCYFD